MANKTFLQLAQDVARESGTVSGTNPTAVTSQTGRLAKIVEWTAEAWVDIQNFHPGWRFMYGTYSGNTTAGTAKYTPASFGLTDHLEWWRDDMDNDLFHPHTIYKTATGVSDENYLREVTYRYYETVYGRGTQTNNRPTEIAISPLNELCFGAVPDADYTVQGWYRKAATRMTADADVPALPEAYEQIIVHKALMKLAAFDESGEKYAAAQAAYLELLDGLERTQLPQIKIGGVPIA